MLIQVYGLFMALLEVSQKIFREPISRARPKNPISRKVATEDLRVKLLTNYYTLYVYVQMAKK